MLVVVVDDKSSLKKMVKKKRQSKRLTLHKKYKIIKKVAEHKRKERKKEALHRKKPTNPGIPNSWPFKEELMCELEKNRLDLVAKKADLRTARRELELKRKKEDKAAIKALALPMAQSATTVEARDATFQKARMEAINTAHVIFYVLDARDPIGSRSVTFEDGVIGKAKKKIVYLLNKIDLVTPDVAEKWTNYLRRFHPTIPVKALNASAVEVNKSIGTRGLSRGVKKHQIKNSAATALYSKTQKLGGLRDNGNIKPLRAFLKEFSRVMKENETGNSKTLPLKFAFFGYPNVGKTTLINSLKKREVGIVSSEPFSTKELSETRLDAECVLLDCPALDPEYSHDSSVILRHAISATYLLDPVPIIAAILSRGKKSNFLHYFQIPMFKDTEDFLTKLANKRHMLRKGGEPNLLLMARTMLKEIGNGSIPLNCVVPMTKAEKFVMPEWFQQMNQEVFKESEKSLFSSTIDIELHSRLHLSSSNISNSAGETIEYDIAVGDMSAFLSGDDETDDEQSCSSGAEEEDEDLESQEDDMEIDQDDDMEVEEKTTTPVAVVVAPVAVVVVTKDKFESPKPKEPAAPRRSARHSGRKKLNL